MRPKRSGLTLVAILLCFAVVPSQATVRGAGPNLIPNPSFEESQGESGLPLGWHRDTVKIPGVEPSRVYICRVSGHPGKLLAIEGGPDRNGRVWCRLKNIRPRTDYLLEFAAYRPKFTNGVYLEVEIFGQRQLINQHFSYGRIQPIFLKANSGATQGTARLTISNLKREVLAFGSASLRVATTQLGETWKAETVHLPGFFPVGIFAATPDDLADIRAAGFNAVQSYDSKPETIRKMAAISARLGLKYLPNFRGGSSDISRDLGGNSELLGFYIEDEPEGRSVPPENLKALKDSLQRDHPGVLTAVAMLRPRMVEAYRDTADIFMLDPYPVPNMPLTWMAETLEEAARQVPRERLWAVIQAFGGDKWAKYGWPRMPSPAEMRCLTYLAVVHGAHGIFYWDYPEIRSDRAPWEALKQVVAELRQLRTWLVLPDTPGSLRLAMTSPFKVDASGRPAVHFSQKTRGAENLLILVNVIDRPVSFDLQGFPPGVSWLTKIFQRQKSVVRDGNIREELGPYEVRLYTYRQQD